MGSVVSSGPTRGRDADNVTSESETLNRDAFSDNMDNNDNNEEFHDAASEDEVRARVKEEEMNEFRKQLSIKREQRREILNRHRAEKEKLEELLKIERTSKLILHQSNEQLRELLVKNNIEIPENLQSTSETLELTDAVNQMREELDKLKDLNNKLRRDLVDANNALQGAYSDIADLNAHNTESIKQIQALKEVVSVSKTLLRLREGQLNELKEKLTEIETSLSDREANMLSVNLKQEYERQLQNIRTLRVLYEERSRLAEVTRQGLVRDLEEQKLLYQAEKNKNRELSAKVLLLDENLETLREIIENKNMEISTSKDEANGLKAEMAIVNKLFSQVLLGYKTKKDLDKLVHRLEENHGLLTHMAEKENDSEASTELPKLLLELVNQMDDTNTDSQSMDESDKLREKGVKPSTTPEEIVENLPKVWRVLMELLSHQAVPEDVKEKVTTCYKLVDTKSGPVQVPSVSQTYIRLKDLIVEKLGLVKEVNHMKQLNAHLECRLQEQEKRLCLVTTELSKTWHVVGKLRRHHFQLHTHEKILKYELQQKRKLLNELKEELEYCREKWEQAREKNTQSERDWKKLRAEFSSRKTKSGSPSFNNSAESGYSDERPSDDSSESNDESEYVAEPLTRCKKKMKKSFETIVDSSADFNLAAEREDPVSDMLDVAELPLDTHESNDVNEGSSECSKSENILKSDKLCETEDEICDIAHDDLVEDSATDNSPGHSSKISDTAIILLQPVDEPTTSSTQLIDPAVILENIRKQNERLAKKDEKLEQLEKNSAMLLKKTQTTVKLSDAINSTLDHLLYRPTNSSQREDHAEQSMTASTVENDLEINQETVNLQEYNSEDSENSRPDSENEPSTSSTQGTEIDFKAILENVRRQNERLAKKDERLQSLEKGVTEVVANISGTLNSSDEILEKLDTIHNNHNPTDNKDEIESTNVDEKEQKVVSEPSTSAVDISEPSTTTQIDTSETPTSALDIAEPLTTAQADISEPSTSAEVDHEARFAARDERLKRLEEQTKSLVKKVNKTNSKGVKIKYKLDELHNIYGSENSRSGTPSEEVDSKSDDDNSDTTKD